MKRRARDTLATWSVGGVTAVPRAGRDRLRAPRPRPPAVCASREGEAPPAAHDASSRATSESRVSPHVRLYVRAPRAFSRASFLLSPAARLTSTVYTYTDP